MSLTGGGDAATGSGSSELSPSQRVGYSFLCAGLVLFSGLMSGLTLGLLSLDRVDLEVRGACQAGEEWVQHSVFASTSTRGTGVPAA
jgi:hypothetical protein